MGDIHGAKHSNSNANSALDYCWKDSYGRGVGTIPYKCSASQETQGKAPFFTCYDKCPTGYDSTALGGCMQTCPAATFRDAFGNCVDNGKGKQRYKFSEYTLVSNPNPGRCNLFKYPFGKNIGNCFMDECKKRNGANGCEWHGAAVIAKCKPGYKKAALHCIPDLDCKGFAGKGVDITGKTFCETKRKPPRPPRAADCGAGYVNDAGLCYKNCAKGYTGVGPVCWVKCPTINGKKWVECGAGCAEDATACGLNTTDMVVSVLDSAISIASLGTGSGITKLTKSARQGLTKGIKQAAKQYGKNFTKRFTSGYKKAFKTITKEGMAKVGVIQDINTLQGTGRGIADFFGAVQEVVGRDISQEEMDFQIAQQALSYGSLLDPSGVMGVVAAYTKPICNVIVASRGGTPPPPPSVAGVKTPAGTAGAAEALMANKSNLIKMVEMQIKGASNDLAELNVALKAAKKNNPAMVAKNLMDIRSKQKEIREKAQLLAKLKSNKVSTATKVSINTNKADSGLSAKVTSAITLNNGATYLFYSNGEYSRTSRGSNGFDKGYPTNMPGGWQGLPKQWNKDIDAAVAFQGSAKSYMFAGGKYVRLNNVKVDKGYPANMPGGWKNMPNGWGGNVDAAIYFPANKKHYFFKGNEYVRLTGTTVDKGYPARLPGGWIGMPSDFSRGIDAATTRAGHVYMIKGDKYIRFTGTKMDKGYPKTINGNWPQ